MVKIIILTGNELRHDYVRMKIAISPQVKVLRTYCCGNKFSLLESQALSNSEADDIKILHLEYRKQIEFDMFSDFINFAEDHSNPVAAEYEAPNNPEVIDEIERLEPGLILVYGSCIIRKPLISKFPERILNAHLGLSPYYRGSGTNYWPLVNGEPEFVGCTFMYLDEGIDTGKIIHQIRPSMQIYDGPHQIGNRLIKEMSDIYAQIAVNFNKIVNLSSLTAEKGLVYRNEDYNSESVKALYNNIKNGMIKRYVQNRRVRDNKVPILRQPWLIQK